MEESGEQEICTSVDDNTNQVKESLSVMPDIVNSNGKRQYKKRKVSFHEDGEVLVACRSKKKNVAESVDKFGPGSCKQRPSRSKTVAKCELRGVAPGKRTALTLKQKEIFLEALQRHSPDEIDEIAKYMPEVTKDELRWHIQKLLLKSNAYLGSSKSRRAKASLAPLEVWSSVVEEVVEPSFDYSSVLKDILEETIAFHEQHDEVFIDGIKVRWSQIYVYIATMMDGESPPDLNSIESAIVLDLLESLCACVSKIDSNLYKECCDVLKLKFEKLKPLLGPSMTALLTALNMTEFDDHAPKRKGRRKHENIEKPSLFSLNPLCISEELLGKLQNALKMAN